MTHAGDGEEALARVRSQRAYDVGDLRSQDAARRRHDALSRDRGRNAGAGPAGDLRHRRRAGTDAERFLAESGCRWLVKPFRLSDLLRAVRETLA